jgi:hypothetical protein
LIAAARERTVARESSVNLQMNSVINFVELENRVISATYRNLMVSEGRPVRQAGDEQ